MTHRLLIHAVTLGCALGTAAAPAYEAGNALVKGFWLNVNPADDSSTLNSSNLGLLSDSYTNLDTAWTLGLSLGYQVKDHWAVEFSMPVPSQHNLKSYGAELAGYAPGTIAEARMLPLSTLLQYHFIPDGQIRPYVGAGMHYTQFLDVKSSYSLNRGLNGVSNLSLDGGAGWAIQAGVDFAVGEDWLLSLDAKYLSLESSLEFDSQTFGHVSTDIDVSPWIIGLGIGRRFE